MIKKLKAEIIENNESALLTATNFKVEKNKFSFDVYTLRTSKEEFNIGNSSYLLELPKDVYDNPQLLYFNSKFSSDNKSYGEPKIFFLKMKTKDRFMLQIYCVGEGEGILYSPEVKTFGEKMFTIQFDILKKDKTQVKWDIINTAIVTPTFSPIINCDYLIE